MGHRYHGQLLSVYPGWDTKNQQHANWHALQRRSLLGGFLYCLFLEIEESDIVLADKLHNFPVRLQLED